MTKSVRKAAFGDFQTPPDLAESACRVLVREGLRPATVVEPTCGVGNFMVAAARAFVGARIWGQDINSDYVESARIALGETKHRSVVETGDFFGTNWSEKIHKWKEPLLIIGNPPWVTNADLSVMGVGNLPSKANIKSLSGLDAMTGKSNFDISEWMLLHLLEVCQSRDATIAMLIKTAVARKVLMYAASKGLALSDAALYRFDAMSNFGAAVDAGLFCFSTRRRSPISCAVFSSIEDRKPEKEIAVLDGQVVADARAYETIAKVIGQADPPWRSGVKHDCARVMELRRERGHFRNGLGERVDVETEFIYPLFKSSDLRGEARPSPRRWLVLPQRKLGDDTLRLEKAAPNVWQYLLSHAVALDGRKSSIYRSQPRFAVFGLGEYSFAPWKIGISGLYKRSVFTLIGPGDDGQPAMLDDTCYFLGFENEDAAAAASWLLQSEIAQSILRAFIFWDAKRPITKDVLDRLNLCNLTEANGKSSPPRHLYAALQAFCSPSSQNGRSQQILFPVR